MRIIDTKGKLCPVPLIETRKALRESTAGEVFKILIDNKTSFTNVSRYLSDNRTVFSSSESGGVWTILVTKQEGELAVTEAEAYCAPEISHFEKGDYVVVLASDRIGDGDEELGRILMKSFFRAVHDLDKLPQKILFYNGGVKLAVSGSDVIDDIRDLERMGVEILLCSTCVNHYSLGESVATGTLSNMFTFAEIMSTASKVVKP